MTSEIVWFGMNNTLCQNKCWISNPKARMKQKLEAMLREGRGLKLETMKKCKPVKCYLNRHIIFSPKLSSSSLKLLSSSRGIAHTASLPDTNLFSFNHVYWGAIVACVALLVTEVRVSQPDRCIAPTVGRPVSYTHLDVYKRQPLQY